MIGQKAADIDTSVAPKWERLWKPPEWALRARKEFPWQDKQNMQHDLQEWLGSGWVCLDIVENSIPGSPAGEYDYLNKIISFNNLAWAEVQRGFRGELTGPEGWRLFHLIIHEALHGYSPTSLELREKGLRLSNDKYMALQVFEEGFTECMVRGLLSQWADLVYAEDKTIRTDLPLDLYPVEVGMIEDLVGEAKGHNVKMKEWWKLQSTEGRSRKGDELAFLKIQEVLVCAGIRPEEVKEIITRQYSTWLFFYPYEADGQKCPPARPRKEGRVLAIMLAQAEALRRDPRENALRWARDTPWGRGLFRILREKTAPSFLSQGRHEHFESIYLQDGHSFWNHFSRNRATGR